MVIGDHAFFWDSTLPNLCFSSLNLKSVHHDVVGILITREGVLLKFFRPHAFHSMTQVGRRDVVGGKGPIEGA